MEEKLLIGLLTQCGFNGNPNSLFCFIFGDMCKPTPGLPLSNGGDDTAVKENDSNQKIYTT